MSGRPAGRWWLWLAAVLVGAGIWGAADAATVHVANNGVDGDGCGAVKHPCRSISRAIDRARAGDTIQVGPGRYGDLNGDGAFGGPGEEAAPSGCDCMIRVNKKLTLLSTDGALVTVLDAGGQQVDVVRVAADSVVFGRQGMGFSLTGARAASGLVAAAGVQGMEAAGNLAVAIEHFGFDGSGGLHPGRTTGSVFFRNAAVANGLPVAGFGGFAVWGDGHTLTNNVSSANHEGFIIESGSASLWHNIAAGNGLGIDVFGAGDIVRNAVLGSSFIGIGIDTQGAVVASNDIYGNGEDRGANCGLENFSGGVIDARRNFWGAPTGPGANPADDACGRMTLVEPFARSEHRVAFPGIR